MDLQQAATDAATSVASVVEAYMGRVKALQGTLQNDAASIKASVARIEKEHSRLAMSFAKITDQMNSQEFISAINNAERLASALNSIADLGSSSLTFAVIDKKPQKE